MARTRPAPDPGHEPPSQPPAQRRGAPLATPGRRVAAAQRGPSQGTAGASPASGPPSPLQQSVLALPGVGPSRAERLAALGVETVGDLLRLAPRRYDDRTRVTTVAEALRSLGAAPAGAVRTPRAAAKRQDGPLGLSPSAIRGDGSAGGAPAAGRPQGSAHLPPAAVHGDGSAADGPAAGRPQGSAHVAPTAGRGDGSAGEPHPTGRPQGSADLSPAAVHGDGSADGAPAAARHDEPIAVPSGPSGSPDEPPAAALFRVQVHAVSTHRPRAGLTMVRARVSDGTAAIDAVWFNQPHIRRVARPGAWLYLFGRVQRVRGRPTLTAPETEPDDGSPVLAGRLVPWYPLTSGLSQRIVRALIRVALARAVHAVPEALPGDLRASLALPPAAAAIHDLHAPPDQAALAAARRRLAFEELLCLQVGLGLRRRTREAVRRGFRYAPAGEASRVFRARLPFALTGAQERVLGEIEADLRRARPMYRLLQGDVGSGKTVVAAAALLRAVESGRQAALMAPTEILAEQHHQRIGPWLGALGARIRLLSGRLTAGERARILDEVARGEADLVVGTHALIQEGVRFRSLGLVVTDEQHRFGVRQRDLLHAKGERPDVLAMTATPIPRTLAFTLYGDLDLSVLDELPPGRRPVRTHWRDPAARGRVYAFVAKELAAGRQAFVVCPRVGEDEEGMERGADGGAVSPRASEWDGRAASPRASERDGGAASPRASQWDERAVSPRGSDFDGETAAVRQWVEELRRRWLPGARLAALHGRMPGAEKEAVMRAFAAGETQCLVATTVVEVGVDVPNASVMVVEGADRFGLAQLHQLRGRVGRGPHASWCILIAPDRGGPVAERLRTLERTEDGFAIAEADLRLRGPGELLGLRQHGLPDLAFADLGADLPLLRAARDAAAGILAADPGLRSAEHLALRAEVARMFGDALGWEA